IAVADAAIREMDADGNGILSPSETQSYAERTRRVIILRVDEIPMDVVLIGSSFPELIGLRSGDAAITLNFEARMPRLNAGRHRILFEHRDATANAVYLAN